MTSSDDFRRRLSGLLMDEGWTPVSVTDAKDALERVEGGECSLILLDTLLPRTTGFDLCRRVKLSPSGAALPVYLFGGTVTDGKDEIVKLWGCEDFLPKTVEDDTIVAFLRKWTSREEVLDDEPFFFSPPEEPLPSSGESEASPPVNGTLGEKSVLDLFFDLFIGNWTGSLTFRKRGVETVVSFERGRPVFAVTNHKGKRLGEWLVRIGRISEIEMKDAADVARKRKRRIGGALVDMGVLGAEELRSLIQSHMEDLIFELFEWEDGDYEITRRNVSRGEDVLLEKSAGNVIVDGVRRRYTFDRLKRELGTPDKVFRLTESSPIGIRDLRLSPSESTLVEMIDGKRSLTEILSSTTLTPLEAFRIFFCLRSLKVIEEVKRAPRGETRAPAPARPSGAPALPLDRVYSLDSVVLLDLDSDTLSPSAVTLLKRVDGRRSLRQAISMSGMPRTSAEEGAQELFDKGLLKDTSQPSEAHPSEPQGGDATAPAASFPSEDTDSLPPGPVPDEEPDVTVPDEGFAPSQAIQQDSSLPGDGSLEMSQGSARTGLPRALALILPPVLVLLVLIVGASYLMRKQAPSPAPPAATEAVTETPIRPAPEAAAPPRPPEASPPPSAAVSRPEPAEAPGPGPVGAGPVESSEAEPSAESESEEAQAPADVPREVPKQDHLDNLRRQVERRPDSVAALLDLGLALLDSREYVESFTYIKKAASLSPRSTRAHYALGRDYEALGDKDKALAEYKMAVAINPSGPYADRCIARILALKKK